MVSMDFEENSHPDSKRPKACCRFDEAAQIDFLENLRNTGLMQHSAQGAGVSIGSVSNLRKSSQEFQEKVDEAMQDYRELISQAIHSRAIEGIEKTIYYKGEECGTETVYSDSLLLAHAKRHMPEYRDKSTVDVTGNSGVLIVPAQTMTPDEWAEQYGDKKKPEDEE